MDELEKVLFVTTRGDEQGAEQQENRRKMMRCGGLAHRLLGKSVPYAEYRSERHRAAGEGRWSLALELACRIEHDDEREAAILDWWRSADLHKVAPSLYWSKLGAGVGEVGGEKAGGHGVASSLFWFDEPAWVMEVGDVSGGRVTVASDKHMSGDYMAWLADSFCLKIVQDLLLTWKRMLETLCETSWSMIALPSKTASLGLTQDGVVGDAIAVMQHRVNARACRRDGSGTTSSGGQTPWVKTCSPRIRIELHNTARALTHMKEQARNRKEALLGTIQHYKIGDEASSLHFTIWSECMEAAQREWDAILCLELIEAASRAFAEAPRAAANHAAYVWACITLHQEAEPRVEPPDPDALRQIPHSLISPQITVRVDGEDVTDAAGAGWALRAQDIVTVAPAAPMSAAQVMAIAADATSQDVLWQNAIAAGAESIRAAEDEAILDRAINSLAADEASFRVVVEEQSYNWEDTAQPRAQQTPEAQAEEEQRQAAAREAQERLVHQHQRFEVLAAQMKQERSAFDTAWSLFLLEHIRAEVLQDVGKGER